MMRTVDTLLRTGLIVLAFIWAAPVLAQNDPNECDVPGEAPDVIVGSLAGTGNYGPSGDYFGYSVATTSCNIGSCWLNWFSGTNEHPVIGQNMYRIKDGRLDQIGQSWLKHGFFALSGSLCSNDCDSTNGQHLGVNCSDPYSSSLNGSQGNLGPRSEVNVFTGEFIFPFTGIGETGDNTFRRIKVHKDDLNPALNADAVYFVEGQYVTADDAQAGRGNNNASWREITVNPANYNITVTGPTARTDEAIRAWKNFQPTVVQTVIKLPNDGELYVGADTFLNGDGTRHYVYALHNLTSDRSVRSFEVPIPPGAVITNFYFHDIDSHSGEPYDTTDWVPYIDYPRSRIVWETQTYAENPNANAIRWGTTYTFAFDIDMTDSMDAELDVGLFKPEVVPGDGFDAATKPVPAPAVCNFDGICGRGETCSNCPSDCTGIGGGGFCGDGICDSSDGENCTNCSDCNGVQSGPDQYCCGDGGGASPVFCFDPRCFEGGVVCQNLSLEGFCCGDGFCAPGEDICQCAADCGPVPTTELTCNDGEDNDCDGNVDCADLDCCLDGVCAGGGDGDGDGVSDCDCDDGNATVWSTPGEPGTVLLDHDGSGTTLSWTPPPAPGADTVSYETLRTGLVDVLQYTTSCIVDGNPFDLISSDGQDPVVGGVYFYLVRVTNGCPGADGIGSLGPGAGNIDRIAPACP